MAKQIGDLDSLCEYLKGVMKRAEHHAANVIDVVGHVTVAVTMRHDPSSLECRTYSGKTTNVLRFEIKGKPYALAYSHNGGGSIEVRDGNEHGSVRASFTNADTWQTVKAAFRAL